MIAGLSQAGLETRLEIGRLDGYRKVMRLLVEGEDGLSKEALMTLQHFLDVQDGQTTNGEAPPQLKRAIDQAAAASGEYGINFTVSPNIVWNTTKLVVREMQKVTPCESARSSRSQHSRRGAKRQKVHQSTRGHT